MSGKADSCKPCNKKKCTAKIGPKSKLKCGEGQDGHHINPDFMLRTGTRPGNIAQSDAGRINPDFPSLNDGVSICLDGKEGEKGSEHNKAHLGDVKIAVLAAKGKPPGTVSLGQALKHSTNAAIAVKPECEKEIRKAVRKQFKGQDRKQRVRGIRDPRKLSKDAMDAFTGKPPALKART